MERLQPRGGLQNRLIRAHLAILAGGARRARIRQGCRSFVAQMPAAVVTWRNRDAGAPGNSHSRKTFVPDMQIIPSLPLLPGLLPWRGSPVLRPPPARTGDADRIP